MTRKGTLLVSVPLGVCTVTYPVVAPSGTVARTIVSDTTVMLAGAPFRKTPVVPLRPCPDAFGLPHFARVPHQFHEGAQTHRKAKHSAGTTRLPSVGRSVEVPVGSLDQWPLRDPNRQHNSTVSKSRKGSSTHPLSD